MVGMGLYLWQTVRGKIRPHAFTNVVNCVVTLIVFAGMLEEGAGAAAWRMGMMALLTGLVALACLRQKMDYIRRVDMAMLVASLMAIPVWMATGDPGMAIWWVLAVEMFAVVPAIRKAYVLPREDAAVTWALSGISQGLSLVAMQTFSVPVMAYFVIWMGVCAAMVSVLLWRRRV